MLPKLSPAHGDRTVTSAEKDAGGHFHDLTNRMPPDRQTTDCETAEVCVWAGGERHKWQLRSFHVCRKMLRNFYQAESGAAARNWADSLSAACVKLWDVNHNIVFRFLQEESTRHITIVRLGFAFHVTVTQTNNSYRVLKYWDPKAPSFVSLSNKQSREAPLPAQSSLSPDILRVLSFLLTNCQGYVASLWAWQRCASRVHRGREKGVCMSPILNPTIGAIELLAAVPAFWCVRTAGTRDAFSCRNCLGELN